jgi:hypothetical protein
MTYRLIQLAPGAYDPLLHDNVVASVVRNGSRQPYTWTAELLEDCHGGSRTVTEQEAFAVPRDQARLPDPGRVVHLAWEPAPEVTDDRRYTHQSIALRGLADAPEIPLSDAALNSLIDTLEVRFPAQAQTAINKAKAKQVPATKARAQTSGETVKVNLDEIEQAMMHEMEKTLQKGKPE